MGINFSAGGNGTTYYEGFPIFKNRVRESSGFTNSTPLTVALDSSGWPNADFGVNLWACGGSCTVPSWLTGTFKSGFVGTGSETITAFGGAVVSNVVHNASPAYTTFDLTNVGSNSGFKVSGTSASPNNVKDVFSYLPEYPGTTIDDVTSPAAFTTESLTHYANYSWIRWMVWSNPINNAQTMTSSNRFTPANMQASYACSSLGGSNCQEGMPQEWAMSFCIAAHVGCWLNLPPIEDSGFTYASSLATAAAAIWPVGLPLYLEQGNELWNGAGAGSILWNSTGSAYPGGTFAYYAFQTHSIAAIFKTAFGARYGTDIRLVSAWQLGGNGVAFQSNTSAGGGLPYIYSQNGWTYGTVNGGDFYASAVAPYINLQSPSNAWTIAQIDANLITSTANAAYNSGGGNWWQAEQILVSAMKLGLVPLTYEGGWQVNSESGSQTNAGAAIMDSGMTAVMNNYYQTLADVGFAGTGTFTDGIDSNDVNNLSPTDELTLNYPITTGNSPRFASILNYVGGWTSTRNLVTTPGATISGGNYLDTSGGSAPNLGANGFGTPFDAPNYGTGGQVTYTECSAVARTASLVVNFTNSGSAGTTGLEYGAPGHLFTILGGGTPTSVAIPPGTGNVTVDASLPIYPGCGYITLGTPNTRQSTITINSLTLN